MADSAVRESGGGSGVVGGGSRFYLGTIYNEREYNEDMMRHEHQHRWETYIISVLDTRQQAEVIQ